MTRRWTLLSAVVVITLLGLAWSVSEPPTRQHAETARPSAAPSEAAQRTDTPTLPEPKAAPEGPARAASKPGPRPSVSLPRIPPVYPGEFTAAQDGYALINAYKSIPGHSLVLNPVLASCLTLEDADRNPPRPNDPSYQLWSEARRRLEASCAALPADHLGVRGVVVQSHQALKTDPIIESLRRRQVGWWELTDEEIAAIRATPWRPHMYPIIAGVSSRNGAWFDGHYFRMGQGPDRFAYSIDAFSIAVNLAACEHGFPCGQDSLEATRLCAMFHESCGRDIEGLARLQVQAWALEPEQAWQDIQALKQRLSAAFANKDLQKFMPHGWEQKRSTPPR